MEQQKNFRLGRALIGAIGRVAPLLFGAGERKHRWLPELAPLLPLPIHSNALWRLERAGGWLSVEVVI